MSCFLSVLIQWHFTVVASLVSGNSETQNFANQEYSCSELTRSIALVAALAIEKRTANAKYTLQDTS